MLTCKFSAFFCEYPPRINGHHDIEFIFQTGLIIFLTVSRSGVNQTGSVFFSHIIRRNYGTILSQIQRRSIA